MAQQIVGWGQESANIHTAALSFAKGLCSLGIEEVFLIVGGGVAPLADALQQCKLRLRHFRHESGAAFAAHEASLSSGRPVAVCVTTGPGIYNALTGIAAARADGGRVLLLSGATSPSMRGRGAVQETSPDTMPSAIFTSGPLFHFARVIEDAGELPGVFTRLKSGFQRAQGFIAHISLPLSLQSAPGVSLQSVQLQTWEEGPSLDGVRQVLSLLQGRRFAVWAGYGALSASRELAQLVEQTGCCVIATPRAKGVFPESDAHYIGVSGAGAHASVTRFMKEYAPEYLLVLGSRLGEVSSFWSPAMLPTRSLIQVDLDESAFGAAYPSASTIGIKAEIRSFLSSLLAQLPKGFGRQERYPGFLERPSPLTPRAATLVRTPYLLQEVQRVIIDGSDAILMAESGNSFAWANHALRFSSPGRYRTSAAFGSMGHFVTGVVGAALGRGGKAVVLAGDGAMLMNNEINSAVAYQAQAVWVVLNDARFGLTEHGMQALKLRPVETQIPQTNFAMFAQSQGAGGVVVEREEELSAALHEAMSASRPFVVDVRIDKDDLAPLLATRIASLQRQGGA